MSMQGGCLCLLVLAVVAIRVSPFAGRDPNDGEPPESCKNALIGCSASLLWHYIGMKEMEILEKFRNTPLTEHCRDWTTSGECARQEINGESCSDVSEAIYSKFAAMLELYDIGSNYVCKEHFDEFDRNFRCLTSNDVMTAVWNRCEEFVPDTEEMYSLSEFADCSADVVKTECGEEASTVEREFFAELLDI